MRFLIVDTYYTSFLRHIYGANIGLANMGYDAQMQTFMNSCFGASDSFSRNLKLHGHEAKEIIINNDILMRQWAKENGINQAFSITPQDIVHYPSIMKFISSSKRTKDALNFILCTLKKSSIVKKMFISHETNNNDILRRYVQLYKPDVLYVIGLGSISNEFLQEIKKEARLFLIAQNASDWRDMEELYEYLHPYDLFLSSFPHYAAAIQNMGKSSEYFRLCFCEKALEYVKLMIQRDIDISFVGGFGPRWGDAMNMFERISEKYNFRLYGEGLFLDNNFPALKRSHYGPLYGLDVYRLYSNSKIVINRHILASSNYANNSRMYEATGMGALLVTEMRENLSEMFEPGKEVVTYESPEEALEKIDYYLKHESERKKIAAAGHERTLKEHTYKNRMKGLCDILYNYMKSEN